MEGGRCSFGEHVQWMVHGVSVGLPPNEWVQTVRDVEATLKRDGQPERYRCDVANGKPWCVGNPGLVRLSAFSRDPAFLPPRRVTRYGQIMVESLHSFRDLRIKRHNGACPVELVTWWQRGTARGGLGSGSDERWRWPLSSTEPGPNPAGLARYATASAGCGSSPPGSPRWC